MNVADNGRDGRIAVHVTAGEAEALPLHRPGAGRLHGRRRPAMPPWSGAAGVADLYAGALLSRHAGRDGWRRSWRVRTEAGRVHGLDEALDRWLGPCDAADRTVLERCEGPVLDVGCGPGRLVTALHRAGVVALGIDVSDVAVDLTRRNGGQALHRDVFAPVPAEGRWRSVLLIDGNIGIGGDPGRLLRRCAGLAARGAQLLVELEAPGRSGGTVRLRLEGGDEVGPWFSWGRLPVDDVEGCARSASLRVHEVWSEGTRWFATLVT